MKKIPNVFERDWNGDRDLVLPVVHPGCEWVLTGEGIATRKWDGTACFVRDGKVFARYDCKKGKKPPKNFEPAQDPDSETGHWPGWIPAEQSSYAKQVAEAVQRESSYRLAIPNGTYELCGPKVGDNAEDLPYHVLFRHGGLLLPDVPRDFNGLKAYLTSVWCEGIVFHHNDGRMAKIRRCDFGLKWGKR